jgi:hypothetical protein
MKHKGGLYYEALSRVLDQIITSFPSEYQKSIYDTIDNKEIRDIIIKCTSDLEDINAERDSNMILTAPTPENIIRDDIIEEATSKIQKILNDQLNDALSSLVSHKS